MIAAIWHMTVIWGPCKRLPTAGCKISMTAVFVNTVHRNVELLLALGVRSLLWIDNASRVRWVYALGMLLNGKGIFVCRILPRIAAFVSSNQCKVLRTWRQSRLGAQFIAHRLMLLTRLGPKMTVRAIIEAIILLCRLNICLGCWDLSCEERHFIYL